MKFFPSNTKYKKYFRLHLIKKGVCFKVSQLCFGNVGIRCLENAYITSKQIESIVLFLRKKLKKQGQVWFRVFPDISVVRKPGELRMGKGKAKHSFWACAIRKGKIVFEVEGLNKMELWDVMGECSAKLPFRTRVLVKNYSI